MRKYIILLILILFALTVTACSSNAPYSPSTETLELTQFTLPEGFLFEAQSQTTAVIKYNDQIIGGITLTGLEPNCIREKHHLSVQKYLDYIAPSPLIGEWIVMEGKEYLSISMSITDSEKNIRTETSRRIFVGNGLIYDCWIDKAIGEDIAEDVFNSIS